jgi:hypothetical protein
MALQSRKHFLPTIQFAAKIYGLGCGRLQSFTCGLTPT